MDDDNLLSIQPVQSPWRNTLLDALASVRERLLIVSPYIKKEIVNLIGDALLARDDQISSLNIRIITRVDREELLGGSSDIAALQGMLEWATLLHNCAVEMRVIPNVHAKVWVCDRALAIVGSGNATTSGLDANLEYALAVADSQVVERILGDWHVWWEQAERVEAQTLEDIAQKLQEIRQSDIVRLSKAQHDALQQELNKVPRIGRRIVLKRALPPDLHGVKEQNQSYAQSALSLSVAEVWHALCWVLPSAEEAANTNTLNVLSNTFLKLFWKAAPQDHQELHFIWADGARYSQAGLSVRNVALQQSWAITLNREQIRMFAKTLHTLKEKAFSMQRLEHFYLQLHPEQSPRLLVTYLRHPAHSQSTETIDIPCNLASIPGNFPTLRRPLSQITISHEAIQSALAILRQEWIELHAFSRPLNTIEIGIGISSGLLSVLTLSTGQIEAPIIKTIVGSDGVVVGSGVRIRIDFNMLQLVLIGAQNNVRSWQVSIDCYAEAIQFIPDSDVQIQALLRGHELRGLA